MDGNCMCLGSPMSHSSLNKEIVRQQLTTSNLLNHLALPAITAPWFLFLSNLLFCHILVSGFCPFFSPCYSFVPCLIVQGVVTRQRALPCHHPTIRNSDEGGVMRDMFCFLFSAQGVRFQLGSAKRSCEIAQKDTWGCWRTTKGDRREMERAMFETRQGIFTNPPFPFEGRN